MGSSGSALSDAQLGLWPSEPDYQGQLWDAARGVLSAHGLPTPDAGEGVRAYAARLSAALGLLAVPIEAARASDIEPPQCSGDADAYRAAWVAAYAVALNRAGGDIPW